MENTNGFEVTTVNAFEDEGERMVANLTKSSVSYCSMKAETQEEKVKLFTAMNSPNKRLSDMINMDIKIKDIYVESVECTQESTGEIVTCPRVVLIDDKGISYQCVSVGIFSAIQKLIKIFGEPTWKTPLTVSIKQITKGERKMLTLELK